MCACALYSGGNQILNMKSIFMSTILSYAHMKFNQCQREKKTVTWKSKWINLMYFHFKWETKSKKFYTIFA